MNNILIFEEEFFDRIKQIIDEKFNKKFEQPSWLRSKDVRKMLGISDATLQSLRVSGNIPSYRLGSSWYYKYDEIIAALESNRTGREGSVL